MRINLNNPIGASLYLNRDYIIGAYFEDIRNYPMLSIDEERRLLWQMSHGETIAEREDAKKRLVESNLRFVIAIAKKFGTKETFLDLVSEGNIGLIKAIEKFDLKKDCKLITYAVSWIIAYIRNYQITQQNAVVPPNALKLHNYIKNVTKQFVNDNERNPTPQEIAEMIRKKFDFNISNLEDIELTRMISISETYSSKSDDETFEDSDTYTSRTGTNNIDDEIENESIKQQVGFFLEKLNKREKEVIKRVYGIGCPEEGYETIAFDMNVCTERIRQICNGALKKMQQYRN